MIGAVIKRHSEVDNGETSEMPSRCSFHNSLFHCGNVVLWDGAAEDVVDELESTAASQRFHFDFAIAKLPVSAALFLVTSVRVGSAANRFPVRNFRRFQHYFGVVA